MNTIKIESKGTKMIAHRGLSGIERENTNAAFIAAGNRSYFGIETDVHVTKDGKFVIIHDETTDRITLDKYKINIEESNYSDIENIVLPDLDGKAYRQDLHIPLLSEYIGICKKYDKICVLEVKNHFCESDLKRMIAEITEQDYIKNVIFISFDFENCINIRKLLPENDVQWLTDSTEISPDLVGELREREINLDIFYENLSEEKIQMLHDNGISVNCWTCDNKAVAEKLIEFGVDYITTNILE